MKKETKAKLKKARDKVKQHVTTVAKTEGKKALRSITTRVQSAVSTATAEPEPATPDFKAGRDL